MSTEKNDSTGTQRMQSHLNAEISRRDFVNGTLVGCGAALVTSAAPAHAANANPAGEFQGPWTGYGGVGDDAASNGNVSSVVEASHLIRDGDTKAISENAELTDEEDGLAIVGAEWLHEPYSSAARGSPSSE